MKKILPLLFLLMLTSCSSNGGGIVDGAEFPSNASIYYSKNILGEDEQGGMKEFYLNGEKIFEYGLEESSLAAFVASNEGYAIQYYPKGIILSDSEDPSDNIISVKSENGAYSTFWGNGRNNKNMPLFRGIPIYETCLKARYDELSRRNECEMGDLMYGDERLVSIDGIIYFDGIWEGVFVYHDYDGNIYSVDLNTEERVISQIASSEDGYGFSFMKEGIPVFNDDIPVGEACGGWEEYFDQSGNLIEPPPECVESTRDLIYPDSTENNVVAEGISRGEVYLLKEDDLNSPDSGSDWLDMLLMKDDIKVASIKLRKINELFFDLVDSASDLCSIEINTFTIYTMNNPCIYGDNTFWLQDEGGTTIFINGSSVALPEGWYLPPFEDDFAFERYNPYYDVDLCTESQDCLTAEIVSPIFEDGTNFGLIIVGHEGLVGPRDIFYLEYKDGSFIDMNILAEDIADFYGLIQK